MALKTLIRINKIGEFNVAETSVHDNPNLPSDFKDSPVLIDHDHNAILFKLQDGPIGEVGVNGCQVDTLIATATIILRGLNESCPCRENSLAITKLEEALLWLMARRSDRVMRGVEGKNHV